MHYSIILMGGTGGQVDNGKPLGVSNKKTLDSEHPICKKLMLETSHSKELSAAEHATIGASVGSIEMAIMRPAVPWQLPSSVD